MSTKTKNGSNGTQAKTATKGSDSTTNGKSVKTDVSATKVKEKPKPKQKAEAQPTPEQRAKERVSKFAKLKALQEDIQQLEEAVQDIDSIRSFGEVQVMVRCNGEVAFTTGRTDTVNVVCTAMETSIKDKLNKAYEALAAFQY